MAKASDSIWKRITALEDAHGERAEAFARDEAIRAAVAGDLGGAEVWQSVANELHTLHAINPSPARTLPGTPPARGKSI
ncbi:hypothetical protein [Sphingopyxis sp. MSC1_008]|jgi:hypothetical protein|uniref:hypothetical protein n=1 Tax=Sphingopyxis sp. MSC1_008 TaxID=2909265 RepID=UPI0020BEDE41|nr:hypothetical protein [Sphingopyxis sp. MSC1_008]